MTQLIYPQSRGDFYFRQLNEIEYKQQLSILMTNADSAYLGFSEERGFITLSLLEKIQEVVKGWLGLASKTNRYRLDAEWLKFLYYGESRGLLQNSQRESLRRRLFSMRDSSIHPSIRHLFETMQTIHAPSERLARMRAIVIDYHSQYASRLQPSFWNRFKHKPSLNPQQLRYFGDTPLALAEQALNNPQPNPHKALNLILEAHYLKNDQPEFERKLALQLKDLIQRYRTDPTLTSQSFLIHQVWIDLAETAYRGQRIADAQSYLQYVLESQPDSEVKRQIGELYLNQKDYTQLEPFLPLLQQNYAHNPAKLMQIAQAYGHYNRYPEGIAAKQAAIQALVIQADKQPAAKADYNKQIGLLHAEIGKAYFQRLTGLEENHLAQALDHLKKAFYYIPKETDYQKQLNEAYLQQYQLDSGLFTTSHVNDWLKFLKTCPSLLIQEQSQLIQDSLMAHAEQAFASHQSQRASIFLQQGLELFANHPPFILRVLKLSIRYKDLSSVQDKLDGWQQQYTFNSSMQKALGDAYWDQDKSQATFCYQKVVEILRMTSVNSAEEQNLLAEAQAKLSVSRTH